MTTITVTENTSAKAKDLRSALSSSNDLDTVLSKVKKLDNTCSYPKCKTRINDFAIDCKYCKKRYCTAHGLQEIHGCGEAVRRDERKQFLHPDTSKLNRDKHNQAASKLTQKLKQMEFERKAKQTKTKKK